MRNVHTVNEDGVQMRSVLIDFDSSLHARATWVNVGPSTISLTWPLRQVVCGFVRRFWSGPTLGIRSPARIHILDYASILHCPCKISWRLSFPEPSPTNSIPTLHYKRHSAHPKPCHRWKMGVITAAYTCIYMGIQTPNDGAKYDLVCLYMEAVRWQIKMLQ